MQGMQGGKSFSFLTSYHDRMLIGYQKQASATVKMGPAPYPQSDPPKKVKILEVDCRGLELVSFKPEVRVKISEYLPWPPY